MDIRTCSNTRNRAFVTFFDHCAHARRDKHFGSQSAGRSRKYGTR
jgi:VanZ family protein